MGAGETPPLNDTRGLAREVPGRECSWQQEQHVQRPWGGTCLISYRSSKEAFVARSEEGWGEGRRGSQPPWGLEGHAEHLAFCSRSSNVPEGHHADSHAPSNFLRMHFYTVFDAATSIAEN